MANGSLLCISGSLRAQATNTMLVREAARLYAPTSVVQADLNFPLYDGDAETKNGVPTPVQTLADQIAAAQAVVISTPEYNKGPSGVLKNALDWVSRTEGTPWLDKPVAVMSAAAGRAGGERAQLVLRGFMVAFRPCLVTGPEVHLAASGKQFDEQGHLISEQYLKTLQALMDALKTEVARRAG